VEAVLSGTWWLLASLGIGVAAALAAFRCLEHHDGAQPPRTPPGARYVALPGYPQPDDPGPDIRYAVYPPGSLGEHPEPPPAVPGRMSDRDATAVVRTAVWATWEAAAGSDRAGH
jgi:hypothetical protein